MPGVAFPPVGPLGLSSPPSLVLCSAQTAILPVSGRVACRALPHTLSASVTFVVSLQGSWCGRSPHTTPGLVVTRSPIPGVCQGDRWLSHVPESPLWIPAPLLDPGGVPGTRPIAPRTVAFRPLETVGFPLATLLRDILLSTTLHVSGLNHAACILAPSSSILPLLGVHVEFAPDRLARR